MKMKIRKQAVGPEIEDSFEAYKDFKFGLVRFLIGRQDYYLDAEGIERLISVLSNALREEELSNQ